MGTDTEIGERVETRVCEGNEVAEAHVQCALMSEGAVSES